MISKADIRKTKRFLEEFSWLLESYKGINLNVISKLIDESASQTSEVRRAIGSYKSSNPNLHFLTGVLPSLFMDSSLFKNNEDIADFANTVLGLSIPRSHKKSKFEIIGHIVCEANNLNDNGLENLVKALSVLVSDESKKNQIAKRKNDISFGWNDVIQDLNGEKNV
ncbi:hypothetical protein [Pseudomonas oryzihabitans]|uniref:hypothetical protein n=1 Tax=Pseudomonas oryzihabitans TaxID=47885 RepID=UPI00135DD5DB|nr:hypothetical protein [Pseudomonas oryzihabitans]MXS19891.1 hypothetical protein [Pseudomonas oryzihabitans]